MHHDQQARAQNEEQPWNRRPADGRVDPEAFALQLAEHVADVHGEAGAGLFLARVTSELLETNPGLREHVSDLLLTDLTEELCRRGDAGREAARMVAEVQRDWMNERG